MRPVPRSDLARRRDTLIPVRLDTCDPPIPFNGLHTLDLTNWDGQPGDPRLAALMEAVVRRVGHVPTASRNAPEVESRLHGADAEAALWRAITEQAAQSAEEYRLYLQRYGEGALFADLARIRIARLERDAEEVRKSAREAKRPSLGKMFAGLTAVVGLLGAIVALILQSHQVMETFGLGGGSEPVAEVSPGVGSPTPLLPADDPHAPGSTGTSTDGDSEPVGTSDEPAASDAVQASDGRIAELRNLAAAWQRDRLSVNRRDIARVLGSVQDLDIQRFTLADEQAHTVLASALRVVEAPSMLFEADTRGSVPVDVVLRGWGADDPLCLERAEGYLRSNGYSLATQDVDAAVRLVFDGSGDNRTFSRGGREWSGALTSFQLVASWVHGGGAFYEDSVEENGVGSDAEAAMTAACRQALDELLAAFDDFVRNRGGGGR